jgi:hypothetical protein
MARKRTTVRSSDRALKKAEEFLYRFRPDPDNLSLTPFGIGKRFQVLVKALEAWNSTRTEKAFIIAGLQGIGMSLFSSDLVPAIARSSTANDLARIKSLLESLRTTVL